MCSRLLVTDSSPTSTDREGLGESHTGNVKLKLVVKILNSLCVVYALGSNLKSKLIVT